MTGKDISIAGLRAWFLDFDIVSDFEIRISDLPPQTMIDSPNCTQQESGGIGIDLDREVVEA